MIRRVMLLYLLLLAARALVAATPGALVIEVSAVPHGKWESAESMITSYRIGEETPLELNIQGLEIIEASDLGSESFELTFQVRDGDSRVVRKTVLAEVGEPVRLGFNSRSPWLYVTIQEVVEGAAELLEQMLEPVPPVEKTPDMPSLFYDDSELELPEGLEVAGVAPRLPVFVASDSVLDEAGEVSEDLFLPSTRRLLQRWIDDAAGECVKRYDMDDVLVDEGQLRGSVEDASRTADWIVRALVTGRAPGFAGLRAGTLLRIQPEEVIKGDAGRTEEHFVFVEVGAFSVGEKRICTPGYLARDHAVLPEVGDSILLFVGTRYRNRGLFLDVGAEEMLTLRADGLVSLPRTYRRSNPELIGQSSGELSATVAERAGRPR